MSSESGVQIRPDVTPAGVGDAPESIAAAVEAVLLTLERPISLGRLAEGLGLVRPESSDGSGSEPSVPARVVVKARGNRSEHSAPARLQAAIDDLNAQYAASGRTFRIEAVAGGVRMMTLPAFAPVLAAFHKARSGTRLSRPAIETLSIIAYRQPITRAQLEAIRGVSCGEVLRSLMERRLVTIKGRAEELGRPILYGTTKEFLDAFGLSSLKDLPSAEAAAGAGPAM